MINPVLSNFEIILSDSFFPKAVTEKYDNFLFTKNYPLKTLESYLYETIQNLDMPGINLSTITETGLQNLGKNPSVDNFPQVTVNRHYAGTAPMNEIIDGTTVNLTFRNTLLNWMYCYEVLYRYYSRTRSIKDFGIILKMKDSAEIPIIKFTLSDCFISTMPGLSFSYNQSFNESKTFDIGLTFNKFDVAFLLPDFSLTNINL
jgi:hypothetical protein